MPFTFKYYEEALVPLKVRLAMAHVDNDSFWFDMKILVQTVWMLTLGRWRPIEEHPEVESLKREIQEAHAKAQRRKDLFEITERL